MKVVDTAAPLRIKFDLLRERLGHEAAARGRG